MYHKNLLRALVLFAYFYLLGSVSNSEPLVILEYNRYDADNTLDNEKNSSFVKSEDYSLVHITAKNETLSTIIEKYYGSGNLNLKFVQSAIVHKNRNVFVRSNPNFMFAGKKLYLPSINEIKNLVYRNKKNVEEHSNNTKNLDIYFFGN